LTPRPVRSVTSWTGVLEKSWDADKARAWTDMVTADVVCVLKCAFNIWFYFEVFAQAFGLTVTQRSRSEVELCVGDRTGEIALSRW